MDIANIDFNILSVLEKAQSKKYVRKLIEDAFMLRNKLSSFNTHLKTPSLQSLSQDFELTESQSHELIINLLKLIEACSKKDGGENVFPKNFSNQLKTLILDVLSKEIDANWANLIVKDITESSTYVGVDWRLDVQVSTNLEKKVSNPLVFLDIESHDPDSDKLKTTSYQLNKQELLNLYENFSKIKEQINLLVQE